MKDITEMKQEIQKMKSTAKNFDAKNCASCNEKLQNTTTVHFMCGHTYHEYCTQGEGIRTCTNCYKEYKQVLEKKEQFAEQAHNSEQFFKELDNEPNKFNTIANYFGRGLFSEISDLI